MKRLMPLLAILCMTSWAIAQEHAPAAAEPHASEHATTEHAAGAHAAGEHAADDPHPALSANSAWAGSMVIIIVAMFVAAAVIGVVVRLNMPEPTPQAVHDDHGHGGDDHGHTDHGHAAHGHDDHSKGGHGH